MNLNNTTKLYSVHNHTTGTESLMNQSELEASWPDLKSGTIEVVDEIDTTYSIPYNSAATLNECISSLWELVTYKDDLTKEDILATLESNLHQIDAALTNLNQCNSVANLSQL